MNAWALAGDPETQARILVLLMAEVCRFVGSRCNPPLGESGEVRWEDSGVVRPWSGWRAQVRGRGGLLLWHLWEAQCCLGAVPFGSVGLDPPLLRPSPSLLFPFPAVGLQAAVTSVGFLQPGPQLVQLRHLLPGPLSQSHLPGEEPAP